MFAKVAKSQTKAAEVSASGPTRLRSTLEGHRLGYDPVEEEEVAPENATAREVQPKSAEAGVDAVGHAARHPRIQQ